MASPPLFFINLGKITRGLIMYNNDNPLEAVRGCFNGVIIGTLMWVCIIIGMIAIADYCTQSSETPKASVEKTLDGK